VPLKDSIHRYFKAEVKPHVPEAWINLDTVKIGYEISFNKYFYRHKPLRSLDDVTRDILALEQRADGLIADILGVEVADEAGAGGMNIAAYPTYDSYKDSGVEWIGEVTLPLGRVERGKWLFVKKDRPVFDPEDEIVHLFSRWVRLTLRSEPQDRWFHQRPERARDIREFGRATW
jgi:hypothetical protein